MKCPARARFAVRGPDTHIESMMDCLEDKCAWYMADSKRCVATQIAVDLNIIVSELHQLVEKVPHEEEFRR